MKNLFSLENPVMQFLSRVGEMMIANVLFLVCSLPIVTGGAALTALNRVMQNIAFGEDTGVAKPFFQAFRDNFRQATIGWLILLVFLAGMGGNLLLAVSYLTGNALLVCKWVIGALSVWILSVGCWYFQLLARYDNTVRQHLTNGAILAVVKLPRTLCLAALALLPALIAFVSMQVFFSTLVYWLVLGFGFGGFLSASLLIPVFRQMERPEGPNLQLFQ